MSVAFDLGPPKVTARQRLKIEEMSFNTRYRHTLSTPRMCACNVAMSVVME